MAKKKALTVKSVHYVHTADIDPEATKAGGDAWEGFVNVCVKAAEDALETPPNNYSPYQRNTLTDIFASMKATHRGIRVLVMSGLDRPFIRQRALQAGAEAFLAKPFDVESLWERLGLRASSSRVESDRRAS